MKKIYWYSLLLLLVLAGTLIERQQILDADPREYPRRAYVSTDTNAYTWQTYQVISNELDAPKIQTAPRGQWLNADYTVPR
jgi:hypothetical protein